MSEQEVKQVFRIEIPGSAGMWYTEKGVLRKQIHILCPYSPAKDAPMPLNLELHRKDGLVWNSAGKSAENMNQWFTAADALNLYRHGYKLFSIGTTLFQELENEILFCRDGIVSKEEVPLEQVWTELA